MMLARSTNRFRLLRAECLESRRLLTASMGWDGPGLGNATLTYNIAGSANGLTQAETNAVIEKAFDIWSEVADINFVPTSQRGLNRSMDISFGSIDGPGGTLAQAYYPDDVNPSRIAGDIQFDNAEQWENGNSKGAAAFDLLWVAVHEIGHSLGLDHSNDPSSVLKDSVSPNQQFVGLTQSDINAIQSLYSSVDTGTPTQPLAPNDPADAPQLDEPDTGNQPSPDPGIENKPFELPPSNYFIPEKPWLEAPRFELIPPRNEGFQFWTLETWSVEIPDFRSSRFDFGFQDFGQEWVFNSSWKSDFRAVSHTLDFTPKVAENHNLYRSTDTNNDGRTSALDALMVINGLNSATLSTSQLSDVNADGLVSALDALQVINTINSAPTPQLPGRSMANAFSHQQATDIAFSQWKRESRFGRSEAYSLVGVGLF